jgi:hypothetical protein
MIKALFLFCRDYGILKSLGHPHFNNGLGRNFDGLAGLRIPTGTGFAFGKDKFADAGKSKSPGFLGFTDGQAGQFIHDGGGRAFGQLKFLGEISHRLRLGHGFLGVAILFFLLGWDLGSQELNFIMGKACSVKKELVESPVELPKVQPLILTKGPSTGP